MDDYTILQYSVLEIPVGSTVIHPKDLLIKRKVPYGASSIKQIQGRVIENLL